MCNWVIMCDCSHTLWRRNLCRVRHADARKPYCMTSVRDFLSQVIGRKVPHAPLHCAAHPISAAPLPASARLPAVSLGPTGSAKGFEAALQIVEDVLDVLGADGQADGALVLQLFQGLLGVGGGSRVDDQRLGVGHVGQQENRCRLSMNTRAASLPPLMSKVKMEPAPFGKYFSYRAWSGRPSTTGGRRTRLPARSAGTRRPSARSERGARRAGTGSRCPAAAGRQRTERSAGVAQQRMRKGGSAEGLVEVQAAEEEGLGSVVVGNLPEQSNLPPSTITGRRVAPWPPMNLVAGTRPRRQRRAPAGGTGTGWRRCCPQSPAGCACGRFRRWLRSPAGRRSGCRRSRSRRAWYSPDGVLELLAGSAETKVVVMPSRRRVRRSRSKVPP